jgi:hypothetical protein
MRSPRYISDASQTPEPGAMGGAIGVSNKSGGILNTKRAIKLGVHPRELYALRDARKLERLERGISFACLANKRHPVVKKPGCVNRPFRRQFWSSAVSRSAWSPVSLGRWLKIENKEHSEFGHLFQAIELRENSQVSATWLLMEFKWSSPDVGRSLAAQKAPR